MNVVAIVFISSIPLSRLWHSIFLRGLDHMITLIWYSYGPCYYFFQLDFAGPAPPDKWGHL